MPQAIHVLVDHCNACSQSDGHLQGVGADHAGADHHDMRRRHARYPSEQDAHAALGFFQVRGAGLDRHASSDLAHRSQQRQPATRPGNGLVGDAHCTGFDQRRRLLGIRRQMQIGIQNLARTQHRALLRLRLLDLDDHLRLGEDRGRIGRQLRPAATYCSSAKPMAVPAPF